MGIYTYGGYIYHNTQSVGPLPINEYILHRTVKIENLHTGAQATGIYIKGGYILTVRHLYSSDDGFHNSLIMVSDPKGNKKYKHLTPRAIFISQNADIAILMVKEFIDSPTVLSDDTKTESITLIGNPSESDFEQTITELLPVPYFVRDPETRNVKFLMGFVCNGARPGYSGSGVFNDQNELIGMMTLADRFDNICMAWPTSQLKKYINEMDVPGLRF